MSSAAPDWARAIAGPDGDPGLAARVVAVAASRVARPEVQRDAIAARLGRGAEVAGRDVLADLEHAAGLVPPDAAATAAAGARLAALGACVLVAGEPGYPPRLAQAWPELGAPLWLFADRPDGPLPDGPAVAVVGTRRATVDGLRTARALGALLAEHGVVVVSGMARGIDQAAHRGALDAGGATVGVLGAGLDVDYPAGSAPLRAAVAAAGGLVTEHLPGVPPRPAQFLWRNRVIAGLADATVVVEGRARSGALHTARLAAAQGREVLAVPGALSSPASRAPLDLIRDGATVVTRLSDVLDAVGVAACDADPAAAPRATADRPAAGLAPGLDATGRAVLDRLGAEPASPGAVAAAAGLGVGAVLAALADLEDRGLAAVTPRGAVATGPPRRA